MTRNACDEYYELSRRQFLQTSGTAAAAAAMLAASPAWLPRVALAQGGSSSVPDVIVSIYLRGGTDGLSVVVPFNDPVYVSPTCRPTLRVYAPDDTSQAVGRRALALANAQVNSGSSTFNFGLHPAMAGLVPAYQDGKLLLLHATGLVSTNKSHFDAQRWMENGLPSSNNSLTGWLGRHLATRPPANPATLLRAIGVADGLQRTLVGSPMALPIPSVQSNPGTPPALNNLAAVSGSNPNGYGLTGTSATSASRRALLDQLYDISPEPMSSAATNTVNTITRLNQIGASGYAPANGAVYPTNTFGHALRTTAALINANDTAPTGQFVEAVAIDTGGWDTHNQQFAFDSVAGVFTGSMITPMQQLANGLGAFYRDVIAGRGRNVTVVVMSEFGRRIGENGTTGTDHGYGNFMMVLGTAVLGGRVLATWPGLPTGPQLTNVDTQVTTDLRHILAEIIDKRLGNGGNLSTVFPGFVPSYKGVFA